MNILITGTTSGLGLGLSTYYLEKGYTVFGISRSTHKELTEYKNYKHLEQDIANFESLENRLFDFIKNIEKLDLVVLNAGILPGIKDMKETSLESLKQVMDVNLWANKILIDALVKAIPSIEQVVAISSGASVFGNRGWNGYSISKAALNMLIKLYARENPGIHFCALAPGLIDSNMQDYIYSLEKDNRFPSIDRLQSAKGTDVMPSPIKAASLLADGFKKVRNYESGSYQDIREI
jgi:NAD(P)-dependent dehydrogenase (short-subunit alcohol dehydrogenase family)